MIYYHTPADFLRRQYKKDVYRDHESEAVRKYFDLYGWFWFHTEWWLCPEDRRPYTFIMRDWIFPHMKWFIVIEVAWYLGMIAWSVLAHSLANELSCLIISVFSGWLSAHLIWGECWTPGQQEDPPYPKGIL